MKNTIKKKLHFVLCRADIWLVREHDDCMMFVEDIVVLHFVRFLATNAYGHTLQSQIEYDQHQMNPLRQTRVLTEMIFILPSTH